MSQKTFIALPYSNLYIVKVQVPDLKCNYDILYIVGSASCHKKSHSKHQTLDQCVSGSGQGEDILLHEVIPRYSVLRSGEERCLYSLD